MMPGNELIHHLKLWSLENSVGTDQPHYFQLDQNMRTISTRRAQSVAPGNRDGMGVTRWKGMKEECTPAVLRVFPVDSTRAERSRSDARRGAKHRRYRSTAR